MGFNFRLAYALKNDKNFSAFGKQGQNCGGKMGAINEEVSCSQYKIRMF